MENPKERKPLSWKPVLHGETYCSPACGGGCTKAAHDEATKQAAELAQQLGPGWSPRVWENLGWHFAVVSPCKRIEVFFHEKSAPPYLAFLGEPNSHSGLWAEHGDTPELAIAQVVEAGKKSIAALQAIIKGL